LIGRIPFSRFAWFLAAVLAVFTADCSVPLAPGYRVVKESREVRFVPGGAPEVRVHAQFTLVNSGTTDLQFLDANLPNEKEYGRADLRAELDGRPAALAPLPEEYQSESPNALRLAFDPAWKQGKTIQVALDYAFRTPADSGTRISLGADTFHLGSRGWFPELLPPKHFMSPDPARPDKSEYTVRIPEGYGVLAGGTPAGFKRDHDEAILRYRLRAPDLPPFIVAGRYVPSTHLVRPGITIFWTLSPIKEDTSAAGAQIAAAWATLQSDFGPLDADKKSGTHVPHIVEAPGVRSHVARGPGPAAAAFPGGALVNPEALDLGLNSPEFLEMVTHALAHNWFGDQMYPAEYAGVGLSEGLPEYATIVVEESREGAEGRHARIMRYLNEYDAAVRGGTEQPLAVTRLTDPPEVRRIGLAKAPLFFAALEDECGESAMHHGLARMVALLRGREVGYDDLRSALEEASGKKLGEVFRTWLNQKGIPQDFRERYEGKMLQPDAPPGRIQKMEK
jgi:hypothetical protein